MTRLFMLTFHGPKRWTEDIDHPHESPPVMTIPLILLAVGSVSAGFLMRTSVVDWLTPVFEGSPETGAGGPPERGHDRVARTRRHRPRWTDRVGAVPQGTALLEQPAGPVVTAARRNLYGDAFNETVFAKPGTYLTRALVYFDNKGIDGLVNGLAAAVGGGSSRLRRVQTGFVRTYALSMLGGALLVAVAFLVVRLG
jgi:NADH-quinone oxidoreductase subunit L